MNGYNFTERVRKVLSMSREEAANLHHEFVGTEHILLGILREGEGVASTILANLGVDDEKLRDHVVGVVKHGSDSTIGPDVPYTSRAKKVLELSMAEARELNHSYVGTEHLLLGLLREATGIGGQSLVSVGVTLERAREEALRILGGEHMASPVRSFPAVRRARRTEPWVELTEPLRTIVESAYARARGRGRDTPSAADLLEATILSSPNVASAFTGRDIEIEALIADVRARTD